MSRVISLICIMPTPATCKRHRWAFSSKRQTCLWLALTPGLITAGEWDADLYQKAWALFCVSCGWVQRNNALTSPLKLSSLMWCAAWLSAESKWDGICLLIWKSSSKLASCITFEWVIGKRSRQMRLCSASSHWALHVQCFETTSFTNMVITLCLLYNHMKWRPIKNAAEFTTIPNKENLQLFCLLKSCILILQLGKWWFFIHLSRHIYRPLAWPNLDFASVKSARIVCTLSQKITFSLV